MSLPIVDALVRAMQGDRSAAKDKKSVAEH
jgi:hypothetical protein